MRPRGWSTTDVGMKRDHNEDSFLCNDALGLYAVADGMGGHLGGEQASRMAIEVLEREMAARLLPGNDGLRSASVAEAMREATTLASRAIYDSAQAMPERAGMGTTLTGLCFHGGARLSAPRRPRPPADRGPFVDPRASACWVALAR
jgi:serine/threonine protein phosphatase PrpC